MSTVLLLFLINAVFRGAGDAAIAMRVLWLGNLLNIVLGPCFIFGLGPFPELGVAGAAVATNIGRGTAVVYQLVDLVRGRGRVRLRLAHLRLDLGAMRSVRPALGFRHDPDPHRHRELRRPGANPVPLRQRRARRLHHRHPRHHLRAAAGVRHQQCGGDDGGAESGSGPSRSRRACGVDGGALQHALPRQRRDPVLPRGAPIAGLFTDDPEVQPFAIDCLRTVSLGFLFYAVGMVLTQSFNGAGDTWTPTLINLVVFWLWEIPLAWWLAVHAGFGPRGVFLALTIAYSTLAVVSAVLFRRGAWKAKRV